MPEGPINFSRIRIEKQKEDLKAQRNTLLGEVEFYESEADRMERENAGAEVMDAEIKAQREIAILNFRAVARTIRKQIEQIDKKISEIETKSV